ncbi:MAG: amidase [Gammaproteobacteria bacterium]|nr:amidase [Gammaproteobacteria bacterium]
MTGLAFSSATELARRIKAREIGCVEMLKIYFDRVDAFNADLNAIIVQMREAALASAEEADRALARGDDLGPLHGVPMTTKESYDIAGTPTTWGVPEQKDNIATKDALAIQRLKAAGAVIFGKTNVPLMLSDFQSYNDIYGTTNNPWDLARTPGGSSGGSAAALAAGLTGLETGSDIGGSIRNPAHFCGVFGHKPTWSLLPPRRHAMPGILSPSDISVIGPLGRSARDIETAMRVMAGPDEIASKGTRLDLKPLAKPIGELSVAVWRDDDMARVDDSVAGRVDAVAQALAEAGAAVDFDARPVDARHSHTVYQCLLQATMSARLPEERYREVERRAAALDPEDQSIGATVQRSQVARFRDWIANNEKRTHLRWQWHGFFEPAGGGFDVLIAPIMATSAFPHDHRPFGERRVVVNGAEVSYFDQVFWAGLASVAYLPATVIPTGPDDAGLPIGVQIIGPEYGDLVTLGVAQFLEDSGFAFTPAPAYQGA